VQERRKKNVKPTDTANPDYYHRVVDCQWACPAHTPVPEYIRLIAAQRYTDAYMVNWWSNVFPGILGRTCDRPCEPACRRDRIDDKPVAICRLKRVAADNRGDISPFLPEIPKEKNGRRIACVGAGPASLAVARDLMPLGYEVVIYDEAGRAGGMMLSQIPAFRLPYEVLEDEVNYILDMGVELRSNHYVGSLAELLEHEENYDAIFIGTGAPRGRELDIPGRREAADHINIGIDWLSSVAFEHIDRIGRRVVVLGGGNTAMDCCRTARRLGGKQVDVVVRSGFEEMKASEWEIEEAMEEDIPIHNFLVPKEFLHEGGRLTGVRFDHVRREVDESGRRRLIPTGEERIFECDDVLVAIGQENSFPWIERDIGIEFNHWDMPVVDRNTFQASLDGVFVGGDAAWGPENIIWAVEHGHQAAISIHNYCQGMSLTEDRPPQDHNLISAKMGMHEWAYSNDYNPSSRQKMQHVELVRRFEELSIEVEMGFDAEQTAREVERCLNCDLQTHFEAKLCIECDACIDICPVHCLTITVNGDEPDLRSRLTAPAENLTQDLMVSEGLPQTGRVMVKDEDLCVHCGLCAERCPTAAWDMRKFELLIPYAGQEACASHV
jgi:NADPH-dependent glutamate synthase beta subunit-like oxidoreductase/ferredoxin